MRRLFTLAVGVALVAAACTSDESDDTTTTAATAPDPVVYVAGAASTLLATAASVAAPEPLHALDSSGGIIHEVDVGQAEGEDQAPETTLSDSIWTRSDTDLGSCVFAKGLIVTTAQTARDETLDTPGSFLDAELGGDAEFLASELGPFGPLPGVGEIVVARVTEGEELATIIEALSNGQPASLYYPVTPSPRWQYGPSSSPREVAAALPDTTPAGGASVHVIDLFTKTQTDIDGHGDFIVGILKRMGVTTTESDVVFVADDPTGDETRVVDAFRGGINSLSAGTVPCVVLVNDVPVTLVPLGVAAGMAGPEWIVASAGNHGDADECIFPQYPAAFALGDDAWGAYADLIAPDDADRADLQTYIDELADKTVSVGATASPDALDTRASFSACDDKGVTVFAPGTNILSDYKGILNNYEDGIAAWDGTSFAAPQVAGLIALSLFPPP